MRICTTAVLMVSALTGCDVSVGVATTTARIEASKEEASKVETAKKEATKASEAPEKAGDTASEGTQAAAGKHHVKISVKDYGIISAELYGDKALITVVSLLKLVEDGLYDRLTFHRIISGFMIQGGDPLDAGMDGSDQEIKDELSNNRVENPLSHIKGAISMVRSQIKNSISSQFFIVHEDSTFLDGGYAYFGYMTEGTEVVDTICEDTKVEDNNGSMVRTSQPVIGGTGVVD